MAEDSRVSRLYDGKAPEDLFDWLKKLRDIYVRHTLYRIRMEMAGLIASPGFMGMSSLQWGCLFSLRDSAYPDALMGRDRRRRFTQK